MDKLQPGDACEECLSQGLNHKLRWFYINLEEQLLKCESRSCLWPHNDEASSDEEEQQGSLDDCDDEFILQLLQQLGPQAEAEPEAPVTTAPNIPAVDNNFIHIEQILELQPIESPKIKALSSSDNELSARNSTSLTIKSDPSVLIATSSSNDEIKFSISIDPSALEKKTPMLDIPKAAVFQTAPKKASTLTTKTRQQQLPKQTKAKPASPPAHSPSAFLDALKRQPETRLVRPARQQRVNRRNVANAAAAGGLNGAAQPNTRQVMQLFQSIEAQKRQKEIKTEPKQEVELEREKETETESR